MSTLFWKEYREARMLVGLGMLGAAVVALVGIFSRDYDGSITAMCTIFAGWPLMAALCAAGAFANEVEGGTLPFLLSLPVARSKVWWSKFVSGLLTLLALMAGSLLLNVVLLPLRPETMKVDMLNGETVAALFAGSLTVFAATFFFSALIGRALVAALAGLAFAGAMAGLCSATNVFLGDMLQDWNVRVGVVRLPDVALIAQFLAVMGLCLFSSRITFVRGELLRSSRRFKVGLTTLAVPPLLIAALMAMPLYRSVTTLPIDRIQNIEEVAVSPQGDRIAFIASGRSSWSPKRHAWILDVKTGRAVDAGPAHKVAWSRDGERLACATQRGFLGIPRSESSLVWMDKNGAVRQKIRDGVYYFSYFPRSDTFLISVSDSANLPDAKVLDSNGRQVASLTNHPSLIWHPDGRSYYRIEPDGEGRGVLRRRYLNGKVTHLAQCAFPQNLSSNAYLLQSQISPNGKWLTFQSRFSPALYIAATDGGGYRVIREDKMGRSKWSADSRYLFAEVLFPQDKRKSQWLAYDVATQTWKSIYDVIWPGLDRNGQFLAAYHGKMSPDRKRLVWIDFFSQGRNELVVIDLTQRTEWVLSLRNFKSWTGWERLEWLDRDRVVLTAGKRVWLVDLKTSFQRQIFPPR